MNSRKNVLVTLGLVLSVSLLAASAAAGLVSHSYSRASFSLANAICRQIIEQEPEAREIVSAALKEYTQGSPDSTSEAAVLSSLGYQVSDFPVLLRRQIAFLTAAGWLAGFSLFLSAFLSQNRAANQRIQTLAQSLEQANSGKALILSASGEDDFSRLEDEIYKTVTSLYHTRDQAVQAKKDFAENLSNIAHQIKTPLTAASLILQRMTQDSSHPDLEQAKKQLLRLTDLAESLLLLSRLDAGALVFQREETDVLTLLVLAADNLQEHSSRFGASVEIPELGEILISADRDWTMEALINLMKNCMEHNPGGTVHCSCTQNPLYTEILIWDEGAGFAREDLPHLFERFYRGKNAREDSVGIGLALAREIIERQNGTLRAENRAQGGALFEIRFYRH